MKHLHILVLITSFISSTQTHDFMISLEPTWQDLERTPDNIHKFGGKWILAGSITFKKKAKDAITLGKIYLQWHGTHLTELAGSLYKKKPNKDFLPIEENIVADGKWNAAKQTLFFIFPSDEHLEAVNTFYLVLTIPPEKEDDFKTGHFSLEKHCLPAPYQNCIYYNKLAFNNIDFTVL